MRVVVIDKHFDLLLVDQFGCDLVFALLAALLIEVVALLYVLASHRPP
jgi:hypothetical protein